MSRAILAQSKSRDITQFEVHEPLLNQGEEKCYLSWNRKSLCFIFGAASQFNLAGVRRRSESKK